jgi:hypothetical protein
MTPGLMKAFEKGQRCANDWRPHVEFLERLVPVYPQIEQDVAALRSKLDFLDVLCETGLGIAQAMRDNNGA